MEAGLGQSAPQITEAFSLSLYAKSVAHKLTLRRSSYFGHFAHSNLLAFGSQRLRLLEMLVFDGNKFSHSDLPGFPPETLSEVVTFSGDRIFLRNSRETGPYVRFQTDDSAGSYWDRLFLDRLRLDFSSYSVLQSASLQNCLHQIDPGKCLMCRSNHHPKDDYQICALCGLVRQNTFDSCGDFKTTLLQYSKTAIKYFETSLGPVDHYNLGNLQSQTVRTFSIFWSSSSNYSLMKATSLLPSLTDETINFISIRFDMTLNLSSNLDLQYLIFNFSDSISGAETHVKYEFDDWEEIGPTLDDFYESNLTIYAGKDASSGPYTHVNFLLNSEVSSNFRVDTSLFSKTFVEYQFVHSSLLESFLDSSPSAPHTGTLLPFSFPVNYLGKSNVYKRYQMFAYLSEPVSGFKPSPGMFLQETHGLSFQSRCPPNCSNCSNGASCTDCESGFYLSRSLCLACAAECLDCVDHAQKCLTCSDAKTPRGRRASLRTLSAQSLL